MADFMVGAMSGGFLRGNPVYDYMQRVSGSTQDNWRVKPNVTMNLGLR
jgi:hypothetical protein